MSVEDVSNHDEPVEVATIDYSVRKRRILLMLMLYSVIVGCASAFLPAEPDRAMEFLIGLPWLLLAIAWCFVDAAERRFPIGRLMGITLVLLFAVAFPLYLLRTRGLRGVISIFLAMLFIAAMFASMILAGFATVFLGDLLGFLQMEDFAW